MALSKLVDWLIFAKGVEEKAGKDALKAGDWSGGAKNVRQRNDFSKRFVYRAGLTPDN